MYKEQIGGGGGGASVVVAVVAVASHCGDAESDSELAKDQHSDTSSSKATKEEDLVVPV
jgi:hypothetical protein